MPPKDEIANKPIPRGSTPLENRILSIRGEKVILDSDLAEIYGVTTKALNQAVKRNLKRFPQDFVFQLTNQEVAILRSEFVTLNEAGSEPQFLATSDNRSQIVTGSQKHRDPRFRPYVFTEHGAVMAANILKSPQATQMSVFVVRAFVKMRSALRDTRELAEKLSTLERELTDRLDNHEAAIVDVLQRIMRILDPAPAPPEPPKPQIGFKEETTPDRISSKPRL